MPINIKIMKKINLFLAILIGLISNLISCKAQILPLNTLMENIPANSHVKDLNNELPPYIGIYKANYQGNEITLYVTKEDDRITKRMNKQFYQDALVIKYIVKNSLGVVLQDTKNNNLPEIKLYSTRTKPTQSRVTFYYSGTHCGVGWGDIYLSKINATQISWEYRPDNDIFPGCPPGTDKTYVS